ncbi:hypothetical protein EV122DRAFT_227139, partial [Schizophyllum commune]
MPTNAGGQTALVSSGKDVNSRHSCDAGKLSPHDARVDVKSEDLDPRSEAHHQASAQDDCARARAREQIADLSGSNIKPLCARKAEGHAPQSSDCDASTKTSSASSYTVSQASSSSQGRDLSQGCDDVQETAPSAPSLTVRTIDSSGMCAAEVVNPGEFVIENCEQRRILDFSSSGGGSAVDKQREEGITYRSSADACDLTRVALPCQSGEKAASPDASIRARAMVVTCARISSHSPREDEKRSSQSAEARHDRDENPEQLPDLDGQHRAVQASAESLSPSSSAVPRRQTTCEPPDKTTSNSSSPHNCEPPSRLRPPTVSSSAPLLRSSHQSTSGRGPDSTNWRARGRPTASLPWEVDTFDADSQSKGISERERASEGFDLQEDIDIEPLKARGAEKGLPQSAEYSCEESPARFPDLDGQRHALQPGTESLLPSPSTAPRRQAARKPPDKTTLRSSSLHRSGSGPDSAKWRAPERPKASLLREVNILNAGLRRKSSPQDAKSDRNIANLHHSRLEAPSEAPAQGYSHVYAGGQVLASSRRDSNPESSRGAGKCLPQSAESSTALTVPDRSVCAQAIVKPRTQMSSHTSLDALECSPLLCAGAKRDRDENPVQFPDADDQCRPPRAIVGSLLPSPSIAPHYHVAREPVNETNSKGSSLHGSRSTSLLPFATVLSTAPLPSLPSSATPRISEARKPRDKNSDRSSASNCLLARHRCATSILSANPLCRSSRRPRYASGPDTADWRVRRQIVALSLHDTDTPDPDQQISVLPRNDFSLCSTRARTWHLPRLDAADIAAPSPFRLHFRALERGRVPKPLEDGASEMKRVHAGGQTVFSTWKDVKPLDARGGKKDPPQFTASDSSSRSPNTPPLSTAREAEIFKRNRRDIGILHAEKLPCVTLSSSADVPNAPALGCATCPDTMLRLKGKVSLTDENRRCVAGYVQRLYDDPGGPADVASSGDGHPSDAYSFSPPSRLLVCSSLRQSVVQSENSRTLTTVDEHVSFEVPIAFALVSSRSAERDMSARPAVRSQIGGDTCKGPMGDISAFPTKDKNTSCQSQDERADSTAFSKDARDLPRPSEIASTILTDKSDLALETARVCSSCRSFTLGVMWRFLDSHGIILWNAQSTKRQTHQIFSLGLTRLRHPRGEMHAITHAKTETGGPPNCSA